MLWGYGYAMYVRVHVGMPVRNARCRNRWSGACSCIASIPTWYFAPKGRQAAISLRAYNGNMDIPKHKQHEPIAQNQPFYTSPAPSSSWVHNFNSLLLLDTDYAKLNSQLVNSLPIIVQRRGVLGLTQLTSSPFIFSISSLILLIALAQIINPTSHTI